MWIAENRVDHQFYAVKKIGVFSLDSYERVTLSVACGVAL